MTAKKSSTPRPRKARPAAGVDDYTVRLWLTLNKPTRSKKVQEWFDARFTKKLERKWASFPATVPPNDRLKRELDQKIHDDCEKILREDYDATSAPLPKVKAIINSPQPWKVGPHTANQSVKVGDWGKWECKDNTSYFMQAHCEVNPVQSPVRKRHKKKTGRKKKTSRKKKTKR